jgi:hypothetical protein
VPVGWGALLLVCALGLGALVVGVPLLRWAVKLSSAWPTCCGWPGKVAQSRQLSAGRRAR